MKITRSQLRRLIKEEYKVRQDIVEFATRLKGIETALDFILQDVKGLGRPYDKAVWTSRLESIIDDATAVKDNLPD